MREHQSSSIHLNIRFTASFQPSLFLDMYICIYVHIVRVQDAVLNVTILYNSTITKIKTKTLHSNQPFPSRYHRISNSLMKHCFTYQQDRDHYQWSGQLFPFLALSASWRHLRLWIQPFKSHRERLLDWRLGGYILAISSPTGEGGGLPKLKNRKEKGGKRKKEKKGEKRKKVERKK